MIERLLRIAFCVLLFSSAACQKNSDSRQPSSGPLNPGAPPATIETPDGGTPGEPAPVEPRYYAYIGGSSNQIGVYRFTLPAGSLQIVKSLPLTGAVTSFMAFHPTKPWVYVANESGTGNVMAFSINTTTGELTRLNEISANGGGPTHVSIDLTGKYVMTANYGTGEVNTFAIQVDGKLGNPIATLIAGTNAHQILSAPSGTAVYVPCLGSNYIAQYNLNGLNGQLTALVPATLSLVSGGPRHMAFHPKSPWAYLFKENTSVIQALKFDAASSQLSLLGSEVSTRPVGGGGNTGAEVQVHPNGSFVYASNRGDNTIAQLNVNTDGTLVFKSATATGGTTPRHFSIVPNGKWILAANQGSGTVTVFKLDPDTGTLTAANQSTDFGGAQFVQVIDLNQYQTTSLKK